MIPNHTMFDNKLHINKNFGSAQQSYSVMSNSLRPHELQ